MPHTTAPVATFLRIVDALAGLRRSGLGAAAATHLSWREIVAGSDDPASEHRG